VTNIISNTVTIINTITNNVIATVDVGESPAGIAVNPDGTYVYVTNVISNTVTIINTVTNTVIATVDVGKYPSRIEAVGTYVYVTNIISNTVTIINTITNNVIATVPGGSVPTPAGKCICPLPIIKPRPVANFSSKVILSVQFKDLSKNATKWYWDFGDGTYSKERNPLHIYKKAGNYTVKLKATNKYGTSSKTTIVRVCTGR
jgi:YVTN family beta-propeller protein